MFIASWFAAGIGMLALTYSQVPQVGTRGLVPLIGVPLIAATISVSIDAYRRARTEEERATTVLRETAAEFAAVVEAARIPAQAAADLLHGRLHGRCVIFAARVDDDRLDADAVTAFRAETDENLDQLARPATGTDADGESIDDLLLAWSAVDARTRGRGSPRQRGPRQRGEALRGTRGIRPHQP